MEYSVKNNYLMRTSIYGERRREAVPLHNLSKRYDPEIETESLKEKALRARKVKFFGLFRYANVCDKFLMVLGFLCALMSGLLFPLLVFTFGVFYLFAYNVVLRCPIPPEDEYFYRSFGLHCSCIFLLTSFMYHFCFMWAAKRQLFRIRIAYMDSVIRQDISFFDNYIDRDLALRMTNDITEIRYGMGENVPKIIFYIAASTLLIILAISIDHSIAFIAIICVPLIVLSAYLRMQASERLTKSEQEAYRKADDVAAHILSSIRAIKIFQGENKELSRYAAALSSPLRQWKAVLIAAFASGGMWLFPACLQAIVFFIFIFYFEDERVFDGKVVCQHIHWWQIKDAIGHYCRLIISFICVLFASIHCANVPPLIQSIKRAQRIAAEIFFTIDWVPRIDNLSEGGEQPRKQAIGKLEMIGVNFRYPRKPAVRALNEVSFSIYPGQIVTFFGQKGDGKTSVVRLLLRLYDACSGKVKVDGVNVERLNVGWLRSQIGVVPQDPMLFNATIEENIRFGKWNATMDEVVAVCKKTGVHSDIESFPEGYKTKVGFKSGTKLTELQVKKISLARVFLQQPRIFVLDHVIGDIDEDFEQFLLPLVEQYREKCTIVMTSDKCNSIVKTSDVIFAMKSGMIVETGNHEFLFSKEGVYYSMLQKTLEQDFGQKPYFTSQLTSYKFAAAISRKHDIHDHQDNSTYLEDLATMLNEKGVFESAFLRHTDPNSQYRLIQPRIIGGFQRYQFYDNVPLNIHYFKTLVRSNLLRERDLRVKLLKKPHYQRRDSTPMSGESLSPIPTSEQLLVRSRRSSSSSLLNKTNKRAVKVNDPDESLAPEVINKQSKILNEEPPKKKIVQQKQEKYIVKGDGKGGTQKGNNATFISSVNDFSAKKDSLGSMDPSLVASLMGKKRPRLISSDREWNLDMGGEKKLQYYLGWTINSSPDTDSIASDDSFFFWDSYNTKVQLAALTLGVNINSSLRGLLTLAKYSWPYLGMAILTSSAIGVICVKIMWLESTLFPAYIKYLQISNVTVRTPLSLRVTSASRTFVFNCVAMIYMAACAAVCAFVQELILGFGTCASNNKMRKQLFSDFLRQDMEWFDFPENDIGFLCNSLAADTACIQMALQSGWTFTAQGLAMLSFAVYTFWCFCPNFCPEIYYMLPFVSVAMFAGYFEESMLGKYNSMVFYALKKPAEIQYKIMTQIREVIMLNLGGHFMNEYVHSLKSGYGSSIRLLSVWRPLCYGFSVTAYFLFLHIWLQVSWTKLKLEVAKCPETIGNFSLIGDLYMTVFFQFGCAIASLPNLKSTLAAAELILSCRKNVKRKEAKERDKYVLNTSPQDPPPEIQLHDVDFAFPVMPDVNMLKGIAFKIEPKQYVAIVGPAKSGKSGLVEILLNLYFPTVGFVTMNNINVRDISRKSIRSLVGLVEQDPTFLDLTLAESIAYGDNGRVVDPQEIQKAAKLANIDNIIEKMKNKYDTKLSDLPEGPTTFVLRQRLAVARVAINPKIQILIVDEATTSMDAKNYDLLHESLHRLRNGRTFIVISQRIEPIRSADMIIVLQNGKIAEVGTDAELLAKKEVYYEIYMSQKLFERNRTRPDIRRSHV